MRNRLAVDLCRLKPGTTSYLKRHGILRPQILKPIHQANQSPFLSIRLKKALRPLKGDGGKKFLLWIWLKTNIQFQEDGASAHPFSTVISGKVPPRSAGCAGSVVMNWRKTDLVPSILRVHPSPTSHGGNITNFMVRHISSGKGDSGVALVAKPVTSQWLPFGLLFFLNIYIILRCVGVSSAICVPGTHGGRKRASSGTGVRKGCEWSCGWWVLNPGLLQEQ